MQTTRFGYKSLPTYYKGITFRSRLEARWAIIFDELGYKWEYEPEAFLIEHYEQSFGYLPDFYMPELDCFVEVKGHLTYEEYVRLMQIAQHITAPKGGSNYENGGKPFIVVGNLGNGDFYPMPNSLAANKGTIYCCWGCLAFAYKDPNNGFMNTVWDAGFWSDTDSVSNSLGISDEGRDIHWMANYLCNGDSELGGSFHIGEPWALAMNKARAARFQDGHHV